MTQPMPGEGMFEFARLEAETLAKGRDDAPPHGWSIGAQEGASTFSAPVGPAAGWDAAADFFAGRQGGNSTAGSPAFEALRDGYIFLEGSAPPPSDRHWRYRVQNFF
jgi:hypothetical protein